jgi:LysR family transcriptional regulator, glycine cleavage system transcriptional activator
MRLSRPPALRSLRAFCIAARHRSFKVAADELALTPSAVSHQIRELERALGVQLFERRARALVLTTAGHMLRNEIAPLLDGLDRSLAQFSRRNRRRNVRVLLPPFFASELFVPRLESFFARHPGIDIQVDTLDPWPTEHPLTADVSVILTHAAPQGVKAEALFALKLAAVCAKDFAPAVARLGREAFRQTSLIVQKARPFAWTRWANELGLDAPEARNVIELDTMFSVVRAAERGVGIALVPETLCDAWFRSGALVRLFSLKLDTDDCYYLVRRFQDAHKPEVIAITDWTLEQFRSTEFATAQARAS